MKEDKNIPEADGQSDEVRVPLSPAAEDTTLAEVSRADEDEAPGDATESASSSPTEPSPESASQAESAPECATEPPHTRTGVDWQFGTAAEAAPAKRNFFWVFGVVVAVSILLLGIALCLGGGFRIIRNVFTERTVFVREYDGTGGLLTPQEAADMVRRSTVTVVVRTEKGIGSGSGFVYRADGYICTNHHVIADATLVQVTLPDGKTVDATVVGVNAEADLAVLKVEAEGLVAATLGSSADLLAGDDVLAVGTPAKLDYWGTATFGKVSFPKRLVPLTDASGNVYQKMTLIQTDVCVNPGNSGGPLADLYGHVVGVVVMKLSDYDGIGFAIPIDGAKVIIDALIRDGVFTGDNPVVEGRSLLGVVGVGLKGGYWYDLSENPAVSSPTEKPGYFQMPFDGVYVSEASGVGARGKLFAGDIILQIDGLAVFDVRDLIGQVNRHYAGETVTLNVMRLRGGRYCEVTVEIVLDEE